MYAPAEYEEILYDLDYDNGEITLDSYETTINQLERNYKKIFYALPNDQQAIFKSAQNQWQSFVDEKCANELLLLNNSFIMNCRVDAALERMVMLQTIKQNIHYKGLTIDQTAIATILQQTSPSSENISSAYLYNVYEFITDKVAPYALEKMARTPIFLSGPHTNGVLDESQKRTFGHYNPEFLAWAENTLVALVNNTQFRQDSQALISKDILPIANVYLYSYHYLQENPEIRELLSNAYQTYLQSIAEDKYFSVWSVFNQADIKRDYKQFYATYKERYNGIKDDYFQEKFDSALGFWLRRAQDKSDATIARILSTLNDAYTGKELSPTIALQHSDEVIATQYQESDKALNEAYGELIKKLNKSQQQAVQKTQRLWIKYRDAECQAEEMLSEMAILACKNHITQDRTQALTKLTQSLQ